ncbi:gamma-glutamylcyclotransferase family protein [Sphingobium sp. MK2]|uniref:gamma-glutamylcyclotransferase family protein n=1 Tax=Sphingobium sp. MK2 TaxID=3116540 RepID=UPI0032E36413
MSQLPLFVYGTLRPAFAGPMAAQLRATTRYIGRAVAQGRLYQIADYPAFVSGPEGQVIGDLLMPFNLSATLAWLDDYEECTRAYPEPHEYRREQLTVQGQSGRVIAWAYIYALPVTDLPLIASGDFLSHKR